MWASDGAGRADWRRPADWAQAEREQVEREQAAVELVDAAGRGVGVATVADAHDRPGLPHRAFSVLLLSPDRQRLLLQRRSGAKVRFPFRWANSCCGHPAPGEPAAVAAGRRLVEELGVELSPTELTEIGVHQYRADDPASGLVENEYDHVLLGWLSPEHPLRPDPAEVAELRWVAPEELSALLASGECAPWLAGVTAPLAAAAGEQWAR